MTSKMPIVTIGYGSLLILIGVIGYFGSGQASVTALIPAFIGAIAAICGVLAHNERFLKHAMHGAAMVGLFGAIGPLPRLIPSLRGLLAGSTELSLAITAQAATVVLSVIFVVLCVRSFIEARRAREAGA